MSLLEVIQSEKRIVELAEMWVDITDKRVAANALKELRREVNQMRNARISFDDWHGPQ